MCDLVVPVLYVLSLLLQERLVVPVLVPDDCLFAPSLKLEVRDSRLGGLYTQVDVRE